MESLIVGECGCGYSTNEMTLGGGQMNYEGFCIFPHYCQECKTLFQTDIFETDIACPKCKSENVVSYDDKRACPFMDSVAFSWDVGDKIGRELKLSTSNNICPQCGKYELNFFPMVHLD